MEAMLQRHCARYIYVIPDGLRELLSDISREVLRSQPDDVYTFIADYLDALMITRENARVAARLVQSLTEMATTTAAFLEETGMPREEIENIVSAIQKTFRKSVESDHDPVSEDVEEANVVTDILNEIKVSPEQAEVAAIIIQQAFRRFKERKQKEKELLSGMVDWRVAARSAIHLYRKTGVTNEEANRAATLIKAAYKGYYTRKLLKKITTVEKDTFAQTMYIEIPGEEEYDEQEGEFADELESDEKMKSVTLDYSSIKPHVDFDTSTDASKALSIPASSATSAVRHSLNIIFDTAFERINRIQEAIPEEFAEEKGESATVTANLARQSDALDSEMIARQEYMDSAGEVPGVSSSADQMKKEASVGAAGVDIVNRSDVVEPGSNIQMEF